MMLTVGRPRELPGSSHIPCPHGQYYVGVSGTNVSGLLLQGNGTKCFRLVFSSQAAPRGLLADGSVGRYGESVTGLIAVAWRRRVLDQPDIIRKDVPRHRSGRVLVTRVLVVDSE
jgi:hypothetical protein